MLEQVLKRRLIVWLAVMLVIAMGLITLYQLPRREVPVIDHPVAIITTVYPGATARQVEQYVTGKLEESIAAVSGIEEITSNSQAGVSVITVTAKSTRDKEKLWNQVQQKMSQATAEFPDGVQLPSMDSDLRMQGVSIYQLVAEQEGDLTQLDAFLEKWEIAFRQLPGVSQVHIQGLQAHEVLLEADPARMAAAGLSPSQLIRQLQTEIRPAPPGKWDMDGVVYRWALDQTVDAADLLDLPLSAGDGNTVLRVGDIASVTETPAPDGERVTYQGKPAVSVSFFASSDVDLLKVDRDISSLIEQMEKVLPAGVEIVQIYTQADPITKMFHDLGIAFLLAMLCVALVSSAGLNRYTSVGVALTIPLALCGGIIMLPLAGVDMNQITLIAFIIVLGILVDDAIVVNENITRYRIQGLGVRESILKGTRGVATSVITSTLIVIFTFLPLCLLSGGSGGFIRPLPVVIVATIIASTLAALFVTPVYRYVLEQCLQKGNQNRKSGWLDQPISRWQAYYAVHLLPRIIHHPWRSAVCCLVLSLLAYALIPFIPLEYFPDVDREEIFAEIELPQSSSLKSTMETVDEIENYIRQKPGIREVNTYYATSVPRIFGMSSAGPVGPNSANMLVFVDREKEKARQVKDELSHELDKTFPLARFTLSVVESGPPTGAPLAIKVTGDSLDDLQDVSDRMRQLLLSQPGVLSVNDNLGQSVPALVFMPQRQAMHMHKVNRQEVSEALRLHGEGLKIGEWDDGTQLMDVRLKYQGEMKGLSQDFSRITLFNEIRHPVALDTVGYPVTDLEFERISHDNYQRSNTIRAYLDGKTTADQIQAAVASEVEEAVSDYPGFSFEFAGENEARNEVFIEIGKIFMVVILLILMVMAVQFNSLVLALLIMTTVLLSSSGALYSLFMTRTALGFMSLMGVISLAGVVVRNGVILVEFMEQKMRDGMNLQDAIQEAGAQRLRPILLTAGTSFLGLMPLALGNNLLFKPLATCIAGGLLYSTMLTLVLIPSLYYLYRGKKHCQLRPKG
ncbi:MAG: efflux RND transporter permease subunit [Bacillota bacterium]|nr:efflux RND transporter permease subunit [Bacillota bacterium]